MTAVPPTEPASLYPNAGRIAVATRLLLVACVLAVMAAALSPHSFKPRVLGSYHLQRFAGWYLLSGVAAAALPRTRLVWLGCALVGLAVLAELCRALPLLITANVASNVYADTGGVFALLFPLALQRWRSGVGPRIPR